MITRILTALVLLGLTWGVIEVADYSSLQGQEKQKEKNPLEGKKGTVVGILIGKEKTAIEVKADGEEKARKYVPQWKGGLPSAGGGPDKEVLKIFSELQVGSRVEVEWLFHERFRALKVTVLKAPEKDKK